MADWRKKLTQEEGSQEEGKNKGKPGTDENEEVVVEVVKGRKRRSMMKMKCVRVQPPDINANDYAKSLNVWETDNAKIITWINNSVSHSIGAQLTKYKTAKKLALTESSKLRAFPAYVTRREEQHLVQFLMALCDDFKGLHGTILNRSPLPSVDSIVHELLAKEIRLEP
ncbi:hypothetical protein ZIOFF_038936 [Zingiber officinale]|uniref:Uncharacterized protein n=1 Tax=Zingiber officinale TaxID=94328 RepID=A0A8J5L3E0_ZINOF|nr:hypothetical protein ZIOFF_038936 [Zingiber officinale]